MSNHFPILNAFIEDTCVIAVIAYLLARGRMLNLVYRDHPSRARSILLGIVFGVIGLSEIVFPGARSPYVVHTLVVTFGTVIGGPVVGFSAAGTITLGSLILRAGAGWLDIAITLALCVPLAQLIRLAITERHPLLRCCIAGIIVQACVAGGHYRLHAAASTFQEPTSMLLASSLANGLGALLLQLILSDARARSLSEQHRLDAERYQAMAAEAQLSALRARVHPHFLFNTLTSIAALCSIAPERAEDAIVRLSQLMRRELESRPATQQSLSDELDYVRSYLQIEQHRLAERLNVEWDICAGAGAISVPPFSVQTMVENAINHGIGPQLEPCTVRVLVRLHGTRILVAVTDDGAGMDADSRRRALNITPGREHGLQLLTQQLVLLHGPAARVRLFSKPEVGTIACFALPASQHMEAEGLDEHRADSFIALPTGERLAGRRRPSGNAGRIGAARHIVR